MMDDETKLEGERLLNTESKFDLSNLFMLLVLLDIYTLRRTKFDFDVFFS